MHDKSNNGGRLRKKAIKREKEREREKERKQEKRERG